MAQRRINVVRALGGPINEFEETLLDDIRARNIYGTWIRASDGSPTEFVATEIVGQQDEEYERTRQRFREQYIVTFNVPASLMQA